MDTVEDPLACTRRSHGDGQCVTVGGRMSIPAGPQVARSIRRVPDCLRKLPNALRPDNNYLSDSGLVVMRDFGVCQQYSDP
jgi:hypothetical protein